MVSFRTLAYFLCYFHRFRFETGIESVMCASVLKRTCRCTRVVMMAGTRASPPLMGREHSVALDEGLSGDSRELAVFCLWDPQSHVHYL